MLARLRLALLRGQDAQLHRQIAAGYARGHYMSRERAEQARVRGEIAALEKRMEQS